MKFRFDTVQYDHPKEDIEKSGRRLSVRSECVCRAE